MWDSDPVSGPDLNAGDLKTLSLIRFCNLRRFCPSLGLPFWRVSLISVIHSRYVAEQMFNTDDKFVMLKNGTHPSHEH